MKYSNAFLIATLLLAGTAHAAAPVTEQNAWSETYTVQTASPRLLVSNLWGSVRVRPGDNGEITVSVTEYRSAPDQERFERSLQVLTLDIEADAGGLSMLVGEPDNRREWRKRCEGCRVDYQFDILVPPGTTVDVGTVMDGRIDIEGVTGTVTASNVNGPVRIDGVRECDSIGSVNGSIELGFSQAPLRDCRIDTINGDITLSLPSGTGLDVRLDLFNGEIVSDLQTGPIAVPATVEHSVENGHNRYRLQKLTGLRIGAGGPNYSISSMNGDVRIQKHQ